MNPRTALLLLLFAPLAARADSSAPPKHTLAELQEMRQAAEAHHADQVRQINDGLMNQTVESDSALMSRMNADREYRDRMNALALEEQAILNSQGASRPSAPDRAPTSAAMPKFQSQSVIEYPLNPDGSQPQGPAKPEKEGAQRNVGFGTRELEF